MGGRIAARWLLSFEFETQEELEAYLQSHPDANPSNHWVNDANDRPEGEQDPRPGSEQVQDVITATLTDAKARKGLIARARERLAQLKDDILDAAIDTAKSEVKNFAVASKAIKALATMEDREITNEELKAMTSATFTMATVAFAVATGGAGGVAAYGAARVKSMGLSVLTDMVKKSDLATQMSDFVSDKVLSKIAPKLKDAEVLAAVIQEGQEFWDNLGGMVRTGSDRRRVAKWKSKDPMQDYAGAVLMLVHEVLGKDIPDSVFKADKMDKKDKKASLALVAAWGSTLHLAGGKARYKEKKEVPKADGSGKTTVYVYGPRQVANRNKAKAERVEALRGHISDLRKKVKADLGSKDDATRMTALAVALIDATFERVGNEGSAENGHFGVTGWTTGHVSFSKDGKKATFKYVGKSGVKHEKTVDDAAIVKALRDCCGDKGEDEPILAAGDTKVDSKAVNDYLAEFDVTAKDLRGFHANREMQERLKAIRNKGPELPRSRKDRDKILKAEFKEALEGAAEAVGHEASTLRSQYLVPGLEDHYMKDGTVIDKLDKTASGSSLSVELEQRVQDLADRYDAELATGNIKWPSPIGEAFADWFTRHFRVEVSNTPKGGKDVKNLALSFLWEVKTGVFQVRSTDRLRSDWEALKPKVPLLVQLFSDESDTEIVRELVTPNATYLNMKGLSASTFRQYVKSLDATFGSVRGWRRKALSGDFKVALAGPEKFRGTVAGKYNAPTDTLFVRATPNVMRRSGGAYGSPEYILIHELGHRFERFHGGATVPYTTPYSRQDGAFGNSEAFAELFALGHFGIKSWGSTDFGDIVDRFEDTQGRSDLVAAWAALDRVATKSDAEREDDEAARLVRRTPKLKPSRDDSKRERVELPDSDLGGTDKDLSLNYKDVG